MLKKIIRGERKKKGKKKKRGENMTKDKKNLLFGAIGEVTRSHRLPGVRTREEIFSAQFSCHGLYLMLQMQDRVTSGGKRGRNSDSAIMTGQKACRYANSLEPEGH